MNNEGMALLLRGVLRNVLSGNKFRQQIIAARSLNHSADSPPRMPDTTMLALQTSLSTSEVLVTIQKHLPIMSHKHLLMALRSLFQMHKLERSNSTALIKDPGFNVLVQNLKKQARNLDINECIEAIKILSYLRVPLNSFILQTLLQLIRCNINFMNIRQIMFLSFVLSKYKGSNHLVDALNLALPLVFQIHLPLEIDQEDLPMLKEMLTFACRNNSPDRCINNIVTGILLNFDSIDVFTAKSIVWALSETNCTGEIYPTRAKLLQLCFDILSKDMDRLSCEEVSVTTARISSRILEKHPEFYHEKYVDAVADYAIEKRLDFNRGFGIAKNLSRIAHTHLRLVEYLCQLATSDPGILKTAQAHIIFGFVNCLANHDYVPHNDIIQQITANPVFESKNATLPWAKFALELATLGCFDDRVLKRVFSDDFLIEHFIRYDNILSYLQLLTLHEAVRVLHTEKYALPENILKKAKELYPAHSVTEELVVCLNRGLESDKFTARNVVLPSGIVIDLVVCIQDNVPLEIAVESVGNKIPIEQLNIPKSALVVCIQTYKQGCYSMNSHRLRGTFRLINDILEKQGYLCIPLNVTTFLNLPPSEQTPYLMREINYKCREIGMKLTAA